MSRYFTEEHDLFRKSFQEFLQKEVVPHIDKWEETGTIERFIWKKFGEMGYFGLNQPEETRVKPKEAPARSLFISPPVF